ncbi:unnamed protein product [Cylicostephanus goldi]|uniref:Acyltransferase 3 domain-containing protein n=1 Tax=Cylicostephanus goldi TaxID=71465 RepID=A0A3P7NCV6_CYLGO|nr:unnamed protein product [Cylicostephanus goldi]
MSLRLWRNLMKATARRRRKSAIAWVIVANHLGWGGSKQKNCWAIFLTFIIVGIIAEFMDHPLWQPLGKLSYCGYIVHFFFISYVFNLDDRPSHFVSIWRTVGAEDNTTLLIRCFQYIHWGIPTVVVSYVFAFFWSCLFEVPIIRLERMLTAGITPKKSPAPPKQIAQ